MAAGFNEGTPALLTAANGTYGTVSSGKTAVAINILLHNTDTSARQVDLYLVPSGGSPAAANQIHSQQAARALRAGELQIIDLPGVILGAGGTVRGKADTTNKVSLRVSMVEE